MPPSTPRPSDLPPPSLEQWLAARGYPPTAVEPLPGDVSPRRYFRVRLADGGSAVASTYPPGSRQAAERFVASTELLSRHGVPVPRILAGEPARGFLLLEDVGRRTLYDLAARSWEELAGYLRSAAGWLDRIQRLPADAVASLNPPLDAALLQQELDRSWEVLLAPWLRHHRAGKLEDPLRQGLQRLCEALGSGELLPCHRDFMARNLVPAAGGEPDVVILDHQDLRLGPAAYDLASLLNDSLFAPPALETALVPRTGLDYRRAVVQRTLKAAATFVTFARRGSRRHLGLVAPTVARAVPHLAHLPELASLAGSLESLLTQPPADLVD